MKTAIECPMTLEGFEALPESVLPRQLIEGQFLMAPAPDRFHQRLVRTLHGELYACLRDHPRLGELYLVPFDVQFPGPNVYQPDVVFFRHDHLDRLTDRRAIGDPDLVVEILSPSTAHHDMNEQRLPYVHGVGELWIVDPKHKHVEVCLRGGSTLNGPNASLNPVNRSPPTFYRGSSWPWAGSSAESVLYLERGRPFKREPSEGFSSRVALGRAVSLS